MRNSIKRQSAFKKQRGSISFFGVGALIAALLAFNLTLDFANEKILDRELDNYARSMAETALKSELAITQQSIEEGLVSSNQTAITLDAMTTQLGYSTGVNGSGGNVLYRKVTFGNFVVDENGKSSFVPIAGNVSNPKAVFPTEEFSAVAVQLYTNPEDAFLDIFVPDGRAIFALVEPRKDCYCDRRYEMCMGATFTGNQLLHAGAAKSLERQNYCEFGYQPSHPSNADKKKFPYAMYHSAWVGNTPSTSDASLLGLVQTYGVSYDEKALSEVQQQQEVKISKGEDPLYDDVGLGETLDNLFSLELTESLFGGGTHPVPFILNENEDDMNSDDISPDSAKGDYHCRLVAAEASMDLLFKMVQLDALSEDALGGPCDNLVNQLLDGVGGVGEALTGLTGVLGLCNTSSAIELDKETLLAQELPEVCTMTNPVCMARSQQMFAGWLGSVVNKVVDGVGDVVGGVVDEVGGLVGDLGGVLNISLVENLGGTLEDLGYGLTNLDVCGLMNDLSDTLHPNVVYDDPVYVGRSGVCIAGTSALEETKCLYSTVKNEYESCQTIISRDPSDPNAYNQNLMASLLAGPALTYPDAIDALSCDQKNFQQKNTLTWSGWTKFY